MSGKRKKKSELRIEMVRIKSIKPHPQNSRIHSKQNLEAIQKSLDKFGQQKPIVVWRNLIIAGNGTYQAACDLDWKQIDIVRADYLSENDAIAYMIADNKTTDMSEFDYEVLALQMRSLAGEGEDLSATGFQSFEIEPMLDAASWEDRRGASLAELFLIPPFSTFDARQGYWQDRKREWLSLGIKSEVGRGENLLRFSESILRAQQGQNPRRLHKRSKVGKTFNNTKMINKRTQAGKRGYRGGDALAGAGTSIFDPVLCEVMYLWFCGKGGRVLDPFAGGSVRGIVASRLGLEYEGLEIRAEQIAANKAQAEEICRTGDPMPKWILADGCFPQKAVENDSVDFIFTCPPYADLEVYSDLPEDLSTMDYAAFLENYRESFKGCFDLLRDDSFAGIIVGECRNKAGVYRGLVPDTINAAKDAGFDFYNEGILINAIGSLCLRAKKQFQHSRKFGKAHQNILVFVKGDPVEAAKKIGAVAIAALQEQEQEK